MKILFLLFFPAIAFAQQAATTFAGNLGPSSLCGRPDATVCDLSPASPSDDQLHVDHTLFLNLNPCNPLAEAMFNAQGLDGNGTNQQMGSVSWLWSGGCGSAGYSVIRLNSTYFNPGIHSDIEYRQWGGQGIGLFRSGDNDICGGRFVCITRTRGLPSIGGTPDTGLVLEGAFPGNGDLFLNSYGSGNVRIALGGGQVQIGTPTTFACPNGWHECMPLLDKNGVVFYIQVGR